MKRLFFLLIVVFIAACSSSQPNPSPVPSISPSATPEPTVQPTPTPTPEPEPTPTPGPTIEEQKEYYETTTRNEIDAALDEYDLVWTSLWVPTFEGLSDGSLGSVEAWKNLDTAELRYSELYRSSISTEGLSDELKKKVGAFKVELEDAIALRNEAISQAKKMIDNNDFAPSTINHIQGYIEDADYMMIQSLAYVLELEEELGVEREF